MIPEEGTDERLWQAVMEHAPALPSHWKPELAARLAPCVLYLKWLTLSCVEVEQRRVYLAYAEGSTLCSEKAKKAVAAEVNRMGGWLFDWNQVPGNSATLFNFGIAMRRCVAAAADFRGAWAAADFRAWAAAASTGAPATRAARVMIELGL